MVQARRRLMACLLVVGSLTVAGGSGGGQVLAAATLDATPASPTTAAEGPVVGEGAGEDFSELGALPTEKVQPADVDWGDLDLTEQRLFTILAEIDTVFRSNAADIWDEGYRLDQAPLAFALRDRDGMVSRVYVAHHPEAATLPGATAVEFDESLGLSDVYRVDPPASVSGLASSVPFAFDAVFGETPTMLFFLDEGESLMTPATWEYARFIVHEAFHYHQLIGARWDEALPDGTPYPREDENAALALLEDRVLAAMVDATEVDEIERRLAQFLAIRLEREAGATLGNHERVTEVAEGTARYVENRYAEMAGRPGRWTSESPGAAALDWLAFGRFYDSGARLGWALDRLGIEWKDRVAAGESLVAIALGTTVEAGEAAVADAATEFDLAAIRQTVEAADLADATNPMEAALGSDLIECLVDEGLDLDPTADAKEQLQAVDPSDPDALAALETCGMSMQGAPAGGAAPDTGPIPIDDETLTACLADRGVDVGPDGLDGLDLNDAQIQPVITICLSQAGAA